MKTYYYDSKRDKFISDQEKLAQELIMLIPNFLKLIYRLLGDERVPARNKILLGAVVTYILSPFDIIPDFVPVLGQIDDLFAISLVLKGLLDAAGEEVVLEHWDGPEGLMEIINNIFSVAARLLPRSAYERVYRKF